MACAVPSPPDRAVGIGLRSPHVDAFASPDPIAVDWLEVHAENYFEPGSIRHLALSAIAERYPIGVHGVALSLGSADGIDRTHLERLAWLVADIGACRVSEHLAWSRHGGVYYNDLLPLPLNAETLAIVADNVDIVQQRLGRQLLVENPSAYLALPDSTLFEAEFLAALVHRTGCGLLLDVNNLVVSAHNCGLDIARWLATVPGDAIGEIHLAGHSPQDIVGMPMLIDSHGAPVGDRVWALYRDVTEHFGAVPTIIERDSAVPPLADLLAEAAAARDIVQQACQA